MLANISTGKQMKYLALILIVLSSACTASKKNSEQGFASNIGKNTPRSQSEILRISSPTDWTDLDPENTLYLDVPDGRIVVALSPYLAPNHTAQIRLLAREGYFDGLTFYRVIEGFVAQAGASGEERSLGSTKDSLMAEFDELMPRDLDFTRLGNIDGYSDQAGFVDGLPAARDQKEGRIWLAHCAGSLAFARGTSANSASATIYFTLQPQRYLDRNLTVIGRIIWGMEYLQSIKRASPTSGGVIENTSERTPILSMRVAADLDPKERLDLEIFDTNSRLFTELLESRRNRPEDFFFYRPNYVDLCQMPIPVRLKD